MMKRKLIAVFILMLSLFLFGCDNFIFPFTFPSNTQTSLLTTRPTADAGTITINETDYTNYPFYESDTYSFTIEAYNNVLIMTRDLIRRSNLKISVTLYEERDLLPWGPSTSVRGYSKGSGVIFKEDDEYYYAITNFHVVDPSIYIASYRIEAFEDIEDHDATLVASSEELDLAILRFTKLERTDVHLINIEERVFTQFNAGELVLAVGNPLSVEDNVTFGEFISLESLEDVAFKTIYHNALIHEGSSGGALVDVDGNLLGINTWGVEETDEDAFAIPNYIVYMFLVNEGFIINEYRSPADSFT